MTVGVQRSSPAREHSPWLRGGTSVGGESTSPGTVKRARSPGFLQRDSLKSRYSPGRPGSRRHQRWSNDQALREDLTDDDLRALYAMDWRSALSGTPTYTGRRWLHDGGARRRRALARLRRAPIGSDQSNETRVWSVFKCFIVLKYIPLFGFSPPCLDRKETGFFISLTRRCVMGGNSLERKLGSVWSFTVVVFGQLGCGWQSSSKVTTKCKNGKTFVLHLRRSSGKYCTAYTGRLLPPPNAHWCRRNVMTVSTVASRHYSRCVFPSWALASGCLLPALPSQSVARIYTKMTFCISHTSPKAPCT